MCKRLLFSRVNAALASYKTILFYLQKLAGLETNFELRDRDHDGSRPRLVQKSRDQDRDHMKPVSRLVSRCTTLLHRHKNIRIDVIIGTTSSTECLRATYIIPLGFCVGTGEAVIS